MRIAPELPALVIKEWSHRHQRACLYALVALSIGGLLALALIAGFVYLIMNNHDTSAGVLLGSGAVSLVMGFLVTRLERPLEPAAAKKAAKKK
jgi:membrane-bound ClpP family serine protease